MKVERLAWEHRKGILKPRSMTVVGAVSVVFGVRPKDVVGPCRKREFVRPRQLAAWFLHELGDSYKGAGSILNRDHTTVMHGVRVAEKLIQEDPDFRKMARRVKALVMA